MRTYHQQPFLVTTAFLVWLCLAATPVWSQGAEARRQADSPLDVVIVTAQKRTQNLQEVPIATTVLDAQTIDAARIQDVSDIANRTPNFYLDQVTPEAPTLTIRGVGSSVRLGDAGVDPSVIVYVDEVYIGRAAGSVFDLFDLERVEVLRGPQGTLFGRNAVGGAIHIITRKPSADRYAKFQASVGNYGLTEGKGVFNEPLASNLFAKVSFSTRDRDGVNNNVFTGHEITDVNSRNVRGQLKYLLNDDLQGLLSVEYSRDEIDGFGKGPTIAAGLFSTSVTGFVPAEGFRDFQNPIDGFFDRDIYGTTGHIDWQSAIGTVTSISAWRVVDFVQDSETAGAPGGPGFSAEPTLDDTVPGFLSRPTSDERSETFSQELRLSSDPEGAEAAGLSGEFHWTIGGYFLSEVTDRAQEFRRNLNIIGAPITSSHVLFDQRNETDSYALFGETSYDLSDQLNVALGIRQTWEERQLNLEVRDLDPNGLNTNSLAPAIEEFATVADERFSAFTPKLSVSYFPQFGPFRSSETMFYTSVSRGFKSGGFDGLSGAAAGAVAPFAKEQANNYEFGFRSRFFENHVQLNGTFFWLDFEDMQLFQRVLTEPGNQASATVVVVNAEEARIRGIEVDAIVKPFTSGPLSSLTLSGNVGFQDSQLTDGTLKSPLPLADPDGIAPAEGQRLPRAPELNYFVSAEYEIPVNDGFLVFRASDRFTDDVFFDLGEPSPGGFQESYHLVDTSITYVPNEASGWEVKLWAENLFDEEYYVSQQAISGGATAIGSIGDPRTYGVTFSWSWAE